jgi:hypothetical protein
MANGNNKRTRLPPFVATPWVILNSKAYIELKHSSARTLPYFLGKPKIAFNKPSYLSTEFTFSYSEAERYGLAAATFKAVIDQLIENGFIDPIDKGGLRGHGKTCSLFRLSNRWENYGKPSFIKKSWNEFKPRK